MTCRRTRADEGAVLVLVLIVVTVLALSLAALLTFADTSVRATVGLRTQAGTTADANGAIDAAANALRRGQYENGPGQSCFGTTNTLALSNFYPSTSGGAADSAAVTCTADPDSGGSGSLVPITTGSNVPGAAITQLGTAAGETGIYIKALNNQFKVHGQIVSNSSIVIDHGSLNVDNSGVFAAGSCSGTITSSPAANCNRVTTVSDPGYSFETPTLTYRPISAVNCTTHDNVVDFQPGYYDDAKGLTDMMRGNSGCRHSTWWFHPGVYYFDFRNGDPGGPAGSSHTWVVNDGTLVAGTPTSTLVAGSPPSIPGACVSPITSTTNNGVQFIFGGDSQMQVDAGAAELCGTYHADRPPIVLYGVRPTASTPATVTPTTLNMNVSGIAALGQFSDATATKLQTADGNSATWVKSGNNTATGTVTATGFTPSSAIPAGSLLTGAMLEVVHGNSASNTGTDSDSATITLPAGGSTTIPVPLTTPPNASLKDDQITLSGSTLSTLATAVHDHGFTGADVQYSATVKHPGTESLDLVRLQLTYTPPTVRALSGCTTATPYGSGSACAVLSSTSAPSDVIYLQGTIYTPTAVLDLTLNNITSQVIKFGAVARSLQVKINGSSTFDQAVIEIPGSSPGFGFSDASVLLTAYVCPASSTCTPDPTRLRLRVWVVIEDVVQAGSVVPGQRQLVIKSWSQGP